MDALDDLSGLELTEDGWMAREAIPATVEALLADVGRVYVPFLLANAAALAAGAERVACTIDDQPWVQRPFPYQAKCLAVLRAHYSALALDDRRHVDRILGGTGCEQLFA